MSAGWSSGEVVSHGSAIAQKGWNRGRSLDKKEREKELHGVRPAGEIFLVMLSVIQRSNEKQMEGLTMQQ